MGFNRNLQSRLQEGAFGENILQFQNIINDPINFGLPLINIAGFTGVGTAPTNPEVVGGNTFQYDDNVIWIKGIIHLSSAAIFVIRSSPTRRFFSHADYSFSRVRRLAIQ